MHSYYANKAQSVYNSNYTIMVAEVASTVNEIILAENILKKEKDIEKYNLRTYRYNNINTCKTINVCRI